MGLHIEHDEIKRLIRQLANKRQSSVAEAVGVAVRNELAREGIAPMPAGHRQDLAPEQLEPPSAEETARRLKAIKAIQDEVAKSPVDWSLTEDEILGYDEFGAPEQPYLSR